MNFDLDDYRNQIDAIDTEIVRLFEERMRVSQAIGEYKRRVGKPVLDLEREARKIEAVSETAHGDFNRMAVKDLFQLIMAISRKRQYQLFTGGEAKWDSGLEKKEVPSVQEIKVAYQGVEGAYSQAATKAYFGEDVACHSVPLFRDAMEEVSRGEADYCVLPIENSTAGFVDDIYDLLTEYDLTIVGEQVIHVDHVLLGPPGSSLETIQRVYSHPQALSQCQTYLDGHPDWERVKTVNTAGAAKFVKESDDTSLAAIASRQAGQLYGLEVLSENLCPDHQNATRFIIVSRERTYRTGAGKVSICFELAHTSGSLYHLLSHIIYNGLNMTRIESRPIPEKAWEYRFFVDFEGNLEDPAVINALRGIKGEANFYRILGNY